MGRHAWVHDYEVEDCVQISIFDKELRERAKAIFTSEKKNITVTMKYSIRDSRTGESVPHTHYNGIEATKCYFGGYRFWFTCKCGRRVAKLYIAPDGPVPHCRHCYNLTYHSCRHEHWIFKIARLFKMPLKEIKDGTWDGKSLLP